MSALRLTARQVRFENRSFWRNPAAAFFTFVFPLMFLVIFNLAFGDDVDERTGLSLSTTFIIPGITAFSVITACYTNIAIGVTFARDQGLLKRVRGTPLPPAVYLAGRIAHAAFVALLLVVIVVVAGILFYGVDLPDKTLPAFLVTLVIGAAAFCSLGLAITAAVPNADASPAVVNFSILPLLFISDIFLRIEDAPAWLDAISRFFPVKHFADALQVAFDPSTAGSGFRWGDIAALGAWGLAGIALSLRFFSWEPRR